MANLVLGAKVLPAPPETARARFASGTEPKANERYESPGRFGQII